MYWMYIMFSVLGKQQSSSRANNIKPPALINMIIFI